MTGATRGLQSGLGSFLALCHEHGVKVGAWRLQHVVPEWSFGEHPTYGVVTLALGSREWPAVESRGGLSHWRKPKDLVSFSVMSSRPGMVDHLEEVVLRAGGQT